MEKTAFEVLGVDPAASRMEIRRAWRHLAKRTHPDVDRSPEAARRFQRLRAAYRVALRQADLRAGRPVCRSRPPTSPAPARSRFRYACSCCDETYAVTGECPRCEVALHDERSGPVVRAMDPAVHAFVAALENPKPVRELPLTPEQRPAALAATLAAAGAFQISVGLVGLAVLSLGFASLWVAARAHGRLALERTRPYAV